MDRLPIDIRKDPLLAKIRNAATSWRASSTCPFRKEHRRKLEEGAFGTKKELAAHILFTLRHLSGVAGRHPISVQLIAELKTSLDYLQHIGALEGTSLTIAESLVQELEQRYKPHRK